MFFQFLKWRLTDSDCNSTRESTGQKENWHKIRPEKRKQIKEKKNVAIESYDLFMQLLVGMAGGCTLLPLSLSREQSKGFGCFAWPMAATTTASTSSVSLCGYVLKRALLLSWISCGCLLRNLNLSKHIGWRIVPCVSKHVYTQTSASVANWQAVSYQTLQPGRAIFHRRVSRTRINFGHLDR